MARKNTKNPTVPAGFRVRHRKYGTYYYYDTGGKARKEIPLGSDYVVAIQKWAELQLQSKDSIKTLITFKHAADRYTAEVIPDKATKSQADNHDQLVCLIEFFGDAPIDEITPLHIRQFMKWRMGVTKNRIIEANKKREALGKPLIEIKGKEGSVVANREIALFSSIFNYAREWGYTEKSNPCTGVKKNKETGRDVYVHDLLYTAVYMHADQPLQDYMDFIYLSGQRNADALKADEKQIVDNAYEFKQGKRGKRVRVALIGEFGALVERIRSRKLRCGAKTTRLIIDVDGLPMTVSMLGNRFDKARITAGIDFEKFQLRDLRAKAGTDKEESEGMEAAQHQLGHESTQMTKRYVRNRRGKLVNPTK
jgi:integrase